MNLGSTILALQNQFDLDDFEENWRGLLNALVACAPIQTAPYVDLDRMIVSEASRYLVEQYFNNNWSLHQRSGILSALAMGARELAGLSIPQPPKQRRKIDFPSKTLPPALHRKLISPTDSPFLLGPAKPQGLIPYGSSQGEEANDDNVSDQIDEAAESLRSMLLSKGARKADNIPEFARTKRLRVSRQSAAPTSDAPAVSSQQAVVPFKDVAAEYFVLPLINRFWLAWQDSTVCESRANLNGSKFKGAGTGLLFSSLAIEKLLMTLALLLHAARYSPVFLAVLAPDSLELAITLGARHVPDDPFTENPDPGQSSQVLAAALEVALVVLDTSVDIDGGRNLAVEKAELVMAAAEWATGVFERVTKGERAEGGDAGGRVEKGSAGVVVRIGEIAEKWAHLGIRV